MADKTAETKQPAEPTLDMPTKYDPKQVEASWYDFWEAHGLFRPDTALATRAAHPEAAAGAEENRGAARAEEGHGAAGAEPFAVVIPPPNVTGSLHMGHALNNTLQDVLVRWKRMQGRRRCGCRAPTTPASPPSTWWRSELAKQGKTRHDAGPGGVRRSGCGSGRSSTASIITDQLKRLGASCDWTAGALHHGRGAQPGGAARCSSSSTTKGLIYQGNHIVNWCPAARRRSPTSRWSTRSGTASCSTSATRCWTTTATSTVATTRPETMLGDTAVAVHPEDERYQHLIGQIRDAAAHGPGDPDHRRRAAVDPEFGTGVVKVTPAHDPNDFEIGLRHDLEQMQVIGHDARMTRAAGHVRRPGPLRGAQSTWCEDLEAQGLLEKVEDHTHAVGHVLPLRHGGRAACLQAVVRAR